MHVKGYAAPETKAAAERARVLIEQAEALGEPPEDPLLLFSVLYGLWVANYVAFNGDAMRDLASQFLVLAEKQGAKVPIMIGHRLMADFLDGHGGHCGRSEALRSGNGALRSCRKSFAGDAIWPRPSRGDLVLSVVRLVDAWLSRGRARRRREALKDAREIGHAATLMYALNQTTFTHIFCGSYATANAQLDEVVALADEKGALYWKPLGIALQGCVLALNGKASDAVHVIESGVTALRSTGATIFVPLYLSHLARAYAELGQVDDAWRCIGEAITTIETTKERWLEAEVHRTAGEIALLSANPDAAKAEAYFERALAVARQQQAKSWELRAAMSIARLWRDQGKVSEARELLAPVYGWFTEGFDTRDLKDAKALLEELAA